MPKGSHSKVAAYLTHYIDASPKSQIEIAQEAGFAKSNIISMLKQGITKLPPARVPAIAKAIDADPVKLFRLCMEEYAPEQLKVMDEIYDRDKLNAGERELIERLRLQTSGKAFKLNARINGMIDDLGKELAS